MAYSFLKDISSERENWIVKVRVTRMWDSINFKKNNEFISTDMILLDEEGTAIQASIRKSVVVRFKNAITEGQVYALKDFRVVSASVSFKPVRNKFKILFLLTTSVTPFAGEKSPIQRHYFEFVDHNAIRERCYNNTNLTDVIGRLHRLDPIKPIRGNAMVRKLELELKDGTIVKANLWGPLAMEIDDIFDPTSSIPDIIILTSTTIKAFAGQYELSTTSASKIFMNLDFEDVSRLHMRFAKSEPCITYTHNEPSLNIPDEELALQNRITLTDLLNKQWEAEEKDKKFTCLAKIQQIDSTFGWSYVSCQFCSRKTRETADGLWCQTCNGPPTNPTPSYKIEAEVNDSTGSTTFVIFDGPAEKTLKKKAVELSSMVTENDAAKDVPVIIRNLCDSSYIFQIKVNKYNIEEGSQKYTVTKMWDPAMTGEDQQQKTMEVRTRDTVFTDTLAAVFTDIPLAAQGKKVKRKQTITRTHDSTSHNSMEDSDDATSLETRPIRPSTRKQPSGSRTKRTSRNTNTISDSEDNMSDSAIPYNIDHDGEMVNLSLVKTNYVEPEKTDEEGESLARESTTEALAKKTSKRRAILSKAKKQSTGTNKTPSNDAAPPTPEKLLEPLSNNTTGGSKLRTKPSRAAEKTNVMSEASVAEEVPHQTPKRKRVLTLKAKEALHDGRNLQFKKRSKKIY